MIERRIKRNAWGRIDSCASATLQTLVNLSEVFTSLLFKFTKNVF